MASKVEIANLALSELVGKRLTSFTDPTSNGIYISNIWDSVVDEVLSKGHWTTVTRRAQLAALTDTPEYEFDYLYQLPTNPYCLVVQQVSDGYGDILDWRREGDQLLTYFSPVYIKYTARITDTTVWGPHLTEAVSWGLIARLARSLTGSTVDAKYYRELAEDKIMELLSKDNQQGTPDLWASPSLTSDIRD